MIAERPQTREKTVMRREPNGARAVFLGLLIVAAADGAGASEPAAQKDGASEPAPATASQTEQEKNSADALARRLDLDRIELPVEARASVDRAVATTGDIITFTVEVERDPDIEVELDEPGAEIAGFRVVDTGRDVTTERGGRIIEKRWYELRADLVGSYILPPLDVRYHQSGRRSGETASETDAKSVRTSAIFVEVESVLPEDGNVGDIRDIKPIVRTGDSLPVWLVGLLAAAALGLLAVIIVMWRRRRRVVHIPPAPPDEIAFAALDELRQRDLGDHQAVRAFYFRLSEIIRAYVEGRFGMNATDLTTEEISARLERLVEMTPESRQTLKRLLEHCDAVKFADQEAKEQDIESAYEQTLALVETTRPRAEEPLREAA